MVKARHPVRAGRPMREINGCAHAVQSWLLQRMNEYPWLLVWACFLALAIAGGVGWTVCSAGAGRARSPCQTWSSAAVVVLNRR
jgi:hypothetical protein